MSNVFSKKEIPNTNYGLMESLFFLGASSLNECVKETL